MDSLIWIVLGVIVVAVSTVLARRLGVAGPLILVAIGLVTSLFLPPFHVEPEVILVGILPPLLYAAAVKLPAVEFRRDARPIAGLAVALVVVSSLALGALFSLTIPGLGFPLAVALGAILSPTDAVATGIVKRLGISPRVVTMLEGESLLNDATALVLLRSAIVAVGAGFAFWSTVGTFVWGVIVAVAIGSFLGWLNLRSNRWITNPAANTAMGFVVPFIAFFPTEHLGGSGLVAAVAAGIVSGQGAARWYTPEARMSDKLTWQTVELVLEGGVFLIMGLELRDIVNSNVEKHNGLWEAFGLAGVALGVVIIMRAIYVSLMVLLQGRRAKVRQRARLLAFSDHLDDLADNPDSARSRPVNPRRLANMRKSISRSLNDLDYYQASPLGWKHGTVIVWAGMRGVVTLAAAQTLPSDAPSRELLILIAFVVAVGSLIIQGLSLPWLIRALRIPQSHDEQLTSASAHSLKQELHEAAQRRMQEPGLTTLAGEPFPDALLAEVQSRMTMPPEETDQLASITDMARLRIIMIEAMRKRLVELTHDGTYSSAALRDALAQLDSEQLSLQLRLQAETDS